MTKRKAARGRVVGKGMRRGSAGTAVAAGRAQLKQLSLLTLRQNPVPFASAPSRFQRRLEGEEELDDPDEIEGDEMDCILSQDFFWCCCTACLLVGARSPFCVLHIWYLTPDFSFLLQYSRLHHSRRTADPQQLRNEQGSSAREWELFLSFLVTTSLWARFSLVVLLLLLAGKHDLPKVPGEVH